MILSTHDKHRHSRINQCASEKYHDKISWRARRQKKDRVERQKSQHERADDEPLGAQLVAHQSARDATNSRSKRKRGKRPTDQGGVARHVVFLNKPQWHATGKCYESQIAENASKREHSHRS